MVALAGVALLVAGLGTSWDWLAALGITEVGTGLGTALTGLGFRRAAKGTPMTNPSPVRPADTEAGRGARAPEHASGWFGDAVDRTDTARMLDYEIEHRRRAKRRHDQGGPDGG